MGSQGTTALTLDDFLTLYETAPERDPRGSGGP